jgi:hypothetical protein
VEYFISRFNRGEQAAKDSMEGVGEIPWSWFIIFTDEIARLIVFIDRGFSEVIWQIDERKQSHARYEDRINNYDEQEKVSHLRACVISDLHL